MTKTGLLQKTRLYAASSRFWPSFILVFLSVLALSLSAPVTVQNGGISLSGYIFPLLARVLKGITKVTGLDVLTTWRILAAVGTGLLLGWIIPRFFERMFCFRTTITQNLVFAGLFIFAWHGYFAYPLADFPALAFFVLGLLAYLSLTRPAMVRFWQRLLLALAMGICLAAATLCLWMYGLSLILLVVLLAGFLLGSSAKHKADGIYPQRFRAQNAAIFLMMGAGIAAVLVPQAFPALVPTASKSPFDIGKSAQILFFEGMTNQKVEYRTITDKQPASPITIADKQAKAVLDESGIKSAEQLTLKRYIRFMRRYPLDIITIYARHLFNGLDVVYPTPYVVNANANHVLPRLVNYSLWFLVILAFRKNLRWVREHLEISVLLLSLLLPALFTIPWTVETRYFLPVFLLLYGVVSYLIISGDVRQKFMDGLNWRNVIAYLLFIALCFTFSASLFAKAGILLS